MRGRVMELEIGSYGKTGRWSAATADQVSAAEAEKDCPIRLQVQDLLNNVLVDE